MKTYELTEDYRLATDERQWILEQKSIVQKSKDPSLIGTENWSPVGYYPHLHMAADALVRKSIFDSHEELPDAIQDGLALFERIKEVSA